jgi:HlyD family secretion protein
MNTRRSSSFPSRRRGASELLGVAAVLALLAGVGGGVWWYMTGSSDDAALNSLLHEVSRDEFVLSVTERGEIESSADVEVRCEVEAKNGTGTAIIRLVEEGTAVQPGDFLCQLDSSLLETERTTQRIAVSAAEALMIQAQNDYETAVIALEEYVNGTFQQLKKTNENLIFVAQENRSRAQDHLNWSERLAAKGHITEQQLEADRFAVEKATKELEVAETTLMVLEEFTKAKQIKTFESAIATTKAQWESAKNSYELELTKLKDIEDQITKCTITAPAAGTVVYAHEGDGDDPDEIIKEGVAVRQNRAIIRLPDPEKMQVELKVNESLVKYVSAGLKAAIRPIGFEEPLAGTVTQVNQFAEPTGWRNPNTRTYVAYVRVDEPHAEIRSGMTALVTIECAYMPDVLKIPVQAVYAHGREYYTFVRNGDDWEARRLRRGPTNDKFIVVAEGLAEGELIALAPRAIRDLVELPALAPDQSQSIVQQVDLPDREQLAQQQEAGPGAGIVARYDSNDDGVIQMSELPEGVRERAGAHDANANGELDGDEVAAMGALLGTNGGKEVERRGTGPLAGGGQ